MVDRGPNPLTAGFWERAERYNATFGKLYPGSKFHNDDNRIVAATWFTGNDYRNRSRLYGAYPPQFLPRVRSLFEDVPPERVLHLFAGSVVPLPGEVTLDASPEFRPTVIGDAEDVAVLFGKKFYLILADPPYSPADAEKYGAKMPNVPKVVSACAEILEPGGYLGWLSTTWPMFSKERLSLVGHVAIIRSTMHRTRSWFVFRRVA
ncbi:MAG TPA: class I SAM-dependent methyltransferase [Thermoplasmata archaeon]|jgi:hypothetical protein